MVARGSQHIPNAEVLERQRQCLVLRQAGADYATIAKQIGYANASAARKAVFTALEYIVREPAEEVLKLELERLDRMQASIWANAIQGDLDAQVGVLRLMDRRAKYLHLDGPDTVVNNTIIVTDPKLVDILERIRTAEDARTIDMVD